MIVKIDPRTGKIVKKFDFRTLYPRSQRTPSADSFNGIAYNASDDTFLVTGKLWPKYYKIRMTDLAEPDPTAREMSFRDLSSTASTSSSVLASI